MDWSKSEESGRALADGGLGSLSIRRGFGDGVPHDDNKAVALYTLACDGGYARGCLNLGAMHFDGTGFPNKDEVLGAQLFQRACDWGEPLACWSVSVGYRDGRGVPKNPSRAQEFAARACSGGVAEACLGPEPKLDVRELEAKCAEGVGAACARLADLYLGRTADAGVVADTLLGRDYDKKACDLGVKKSCAATKMAPDVDRLNNTAARANAMFESECNRGILLGCTFLAESLLSANAVPADRDRAKALLDRACKGGVQKACEDLAKAGNR